MLRITGKLSPKGKVYVYSFAAKPWEKISTNWEKVSVTWDSW